MRRLALASLLLVSLLVLGILWLQRPPAQASASKQPPVLRVLAAAGLKPVLEEVSLAYERAHGVRLEITYGGSGQILASLSTVPGVDLFVPADTGYLDLARKSGLIRESVPLASMRPVLGVPKGNPKKLASLDDLFSPGVRYGLCHAEAAAIGKSVKASAQKLGRWDDLLSHAAVLKTTVNELALDLQTGALDAAFVWDQTAASFPGLEAVTIPAFAEGEARVSASVTTASTHPADALRFARFLSSPEFGAPVFRRRGFSPEAGDAWASSPELILYAGAVNRLVLEPLLKSFSDREGVRVRTVYNSCGLLCASMRSLQENPGSALPDAYLACDICFVPPVADLFPEAVTVSETDIVIAVPRGNPRKITDLSDLATPGLRVGVCNAEQSALGFLTLRLLDKTALAESVFHRASAQAPTADLLVTQMLAGSLDAAVVYRANLVGAKGQLDFVAVNHPAAKAVQPYSVAAHSPRRELAKRLLAHLQANPTAFVEAGFRPLSDSLPVPSTAYEGAGFRKK